MGGATGLTVWSSGLPTPLAENDASPLYAARIVCVPFVSDEIARTAWSFPLTMWSGTGASETPSIVKTTFPDGLPAVPVAETMTVNVTLWPTVDGSTEDVSTVAVGCMLRAFTTCVGSDPLLELTCASPLYAAVTECCPAVSVEVANCTSSCPPTMASCTGACAWPSMVNVTVPVGVPWYEGAETTAANVTCWPTVEGICRARERGCRRLHGRSVHDLRRE